MSKNVWKPTEKELEEMGFVKHIYYSIKRYILGTQYDWIRCAIYEYSDAEPTYDWEIFVEVDEGGFVPLYPESRQDVETLIRLMTP